MELEIPRDRNGEFESAVVPKNKRDISGIEDKVISLYARGMSTRDIHDQIQDIYGVEMSAEMVSKITDKLLPYITEWKDRKAFARDFKGVYTSINEEEAYEKLMGLEEKWGNKYPYAIKSWESNWDVISPFFKFPTEIRRIMYTTNIIEGLHRQFRKVTKTKSIFSSDQALEKILYLASQNIIKNGPKDIEIRT